MKKKYNVFWEEDKIKSSEFLKDLGLQKGDVAIIDKWFYNFLQFHSDSNSFEDGMRHENELREQVNSLIPKPGNQLYIYFLGKLIKYYNISNSGYFKPLIIARLDVLLNNLIAEYIRKRKVLYSSTEFIALTRYLQCMHVSPNGNLIENILKIESKNKICKKATTDERTEILTNILSINSNKDFHHDIKDYKKILSLVEKNDRQFINDISEYKVGNKQGCYQLIKTIFDIPFFTGKWQDFKIKQEIIICFDLSNGANPKDNWKKKLDSIINSVEISQLELLCDKIIEQEDLKNYHFTRTQWSDDVVKRFLKGAKWTKKLINSN